MTLRGINDLVLAIDKEQRKKPRVKPRMLQGMSVGMSEKWLHVLRSQGVEPDA